MDFLGETTAGYDNCGSLPGMNDHALWATEDDYRAWNEGGGYEPPNKKSRTSQGSESQVVVPIRSKAIGKMFFKTKLCCKFRAGVCPYITNCNFAHGLEELRKPPPNWQEIVTAHEGGVGFENYREEHQIPIMTSPESRADFQRSHKGRHCKKFYTEEGCPFGDSCTYIHDEQARSRESVAISVTPTMGDFDKNNSTAMYQKPTNWKTRICNKWETTGYCPFGTKCRFAHGAAELHNFGGAQVEGEGKDSASDIKAGGGSSLKPVDLKVASTTYLPSNNTSQRRPIQKWKGPNKISKIYGDWIDDMD